MAIDISKEFSAQNRAGQVYLDLLIRGAPIRRVLNPALRSLLPAGTDRSPVACEISRKFDEQAQHYQEHRWAFVENVFPDDFHARLRDNFPPRRYLEPVTQREKSYDRFMLTDRTRDRFAGFVELLALFDHLKSPEFERRVCALAGQEGMRSMGPLTITRSWPGTFVAPHRDGAQRDPRIVARVNMIFFVDGSGGKNSGGLCLSNDNELRDPIVEPENLTNSVLIYDVMAPFFHGFRPVARNKFRNAVIMNWQLREE